MQTQSAPRRRRVLFRAETLSPAKGEQSAGKFVDPLIRSGLETSSSLEYCRSSQTRRVAARRTAGSRQSWRKKRNLPNETYNSSLNTK